MFRSLVINKYLSKDFLKILFNMILVFFCLSTVMNLFEEINFFKDFDIGIFVPIMMSILIVPNVLYTLLPFIILLSAIWLFLRLIKTDEVIAMKTSGFSNFSVIVIPCIVAFLLGIFVVIAINPITSLLVEKYENIKASYHTDKEYLAAITANGIWIKEKNNDVKSIIRSSNLKNNRLENVSIYKFDNDNILLSRMEAKFANIENTTWVLKNVEEYIIDENFTSNKYDEITYQSIYDINKIRSLYSNLDTISFWKIQNQIEILQKRGYSTKEMQGKFQKAISFPFFLMSMVLLAGVFTLGMRYRGSNWSYIFIAIIACVIIYYCNYFSLALGKTEKLPIELSVWMPVIIVFIFSSVGLMHVNQK